MKTILKKMLFGVAMMLAGMAGAAATGTLVTFSSAGPDAYPDGTTVVDGEYYALAWAESAAKLVMGTDGTVAEGRVLAKVAVAEDGRCPPVNVKLDAETASACKDGVWGVFLLDTRGSSGGELRISSATLISDATVEIVSNGFLSHVRLRSGALKASGITDGVTDNPVAAIGTTGYAKLTDAISAANDGETVRLLADVSNVVDTVKISKSLVLDGDGHRIVAKPVPADGHRSVGNVWGGGKSMLKVEASGITIRNIELDGGETHAFTYLVSADSASASFTTENITLLHGGELAGGADGTVVQPGAGYGAAIHLNNGASLTVKDGFYADTHGAPAQPGETVAKTDGVFPFTGIFPEKIETGTSVKFELTEDTDTNPTVSIGEDLLLVGMEGVLPLDQVAGILAYMQVPSRFIPYTLTLSDGSDYAFTGASPRTWNDIIDYGKEIMDASTAIGYQGLDKDSTPVEVGLLTDTALPDTFTFADTNFTVNGNGHALSGTIKYTDTAGKVENLVLGTDTDPLVLDMTGISKPIELGSGIGITNVIVKMTPEQATQGTPVVTWKADDGVEPPANEEGVVVQLVDDHGTPTGDTAELIWDDTLGLAYIGPCEARLTGPGHEKPIYTSLARAIALAAQSGDTVTLMMDIENFSGKQDIGKSLTLDGAGYEIVAADDASGEEMFDVAGDVAVTIKDLTIDGAHKYTYCVQAYGDGANLTLEDVTVLHGTKEWFGSFKYGAGVHVNGAHLVVSGDFTAFSGGKTDESFPFTGILYSDGTIRFEDGATASIANPNDATDTDLLLVGRLGALDVSDPADRAEVETMLAGMNVPAGFYPYTLKINPDEWGYTFDENTSFTGASPLGWNDIIDYGKAIMGAIGMDTAETPVEVGLLTDTILPDTFTFEDSNFTVNGNGYALSGEIAYTDNAGLIENLVMGTAESPLVLDMRDATQPVVLGADIEVNNVVVKMTPEQATAGTPVIIWDAEGGINAPANESGVTVALVDAQGEPTGETASLIWDDELGIAYIGPVEARLTGPTHDKPIYTTLANAIALAEQSGDTVTLLMDIENYTGTQGISKSDLVLDGAGHKIAAAPVTDYPNFFAAYSGAPMLKLETGAITLKNLTLDGDATHRYTYLVSGDNGSVALTTENITLLHGGAQSLDRDGNLTPGVGYGAAIHLNGGASLTVKDGFYADTHGAPAEAGQTIDNADGIFPFTGILPEGLDQGTSVKFELTKDSDANPTVSIGADLLLVGMLGAAPADQVQPILDYMKVPKRFIPYTLTLDDGSAYAFTGASPRGWNDIIDYGKEIMDGATAIGYDGLDKTETPVEVGLLTDTALPDTFTFEDGNFTVNGNGHALSGTIKYTDTAGKVENLVLGTDTDPLVLDMRGTSHPVSLGGGVEVDNVTILMTENQASYGALVFDWGANGVDSSEAPEHNVDVSVTVVDSSGTPTGDTKGVVWDDELGVAYIGPCEARLSDNLGGMPLYTTLTNAFAAAKGGDTITIFMAGVTLNETIGLPPYTVSLMKGAYDLTAATGAGFAITNLSTTFKSDMDLAPLISVNEGWMLKCTEDGPTNIYSAVVRGTYSVSVVAPGGVPGTAPITVDDGWVAENVPGAKTVGEVETKLDEVQAATGIKIWQSYVLNQAEKVAVTGVADGTDAISTTLGVPKMASATGFNVRYSVDRVTTNSATVAGGEAKDALSGLVLPVEDVLSNAFYKVRVHLIAVGGEGEDVVETTNTIGVLKVDSSSDMTIMAVPWKPFGVDGAMSVSNLVRTASLKEGDELCAYDSSAGGYRAWELASGAWKPFTTATETGMIVGRDAASVMVQRGMGVWLKRQTPSSSPIYLVGELAFGAVETALEPADQSVVDSEGSVKPKWNLVAAPSFEPVEIQAVLGSNTSDMAIVPTGTVPKRFTYENGSWGYSATAPVIENGVKVGVRPVRNTEATKIPAGTGFWYLNTQGAKSIRW